MKQYRSDNPITTTLVLVHQHPKILLGMKKRGFGEGRWNGFGGKVRDNESIEEAACREMQEEAGIVVRDLAKRGVLTFHFTTEQDSVDMHVFSTDTYSGEITESEEMLPQWFHVDELPFDEMWPNDQHWYPFFLDGHNVGGECLFDENDRIIEHNFLADTEL